MSEPRLRPEHGVWLLFAERVYEGKCGACGAKSPVLHHGHIIRHADDGPANWENAIPVCPACNNKYRKTDTPTTYRPTDWRERLGVLFLQQLFGNRIQGKLLVSFPNKPDTDQRVIDFSGDQKQALFPESIPKPLSLNEATLLVERWISHARQGESTPWVPKEKTKSKLIGLAMKNGREVFAGACREFVAEKWWLDRHGEPRPGEHWLPLADGFFDYHGRHRKRLQREADEKVAAEKERLESIRLRRLVWQNGLRRPFADVLKIPADCTILTEPDKQLIAYVRGLDLARGFSMVDWDRCAVLSERYSQWQREEWDRKRQEKWKAQTFESAKTKLLTQLAEVQKLRQYEEWLSFHESNETGWNNIWYGIKNATTIGELKPLVRFVDSLKTIIGSFDLQAARNTRAEWGGGQSDEKDQS